MSLLLAGVLFCSLSTAEIKQSAQREVMNVTAYTSSYEETGKKKGDPSYNITSSGDQASRGITVSASKDIPLGTKVYVPYFDGLDGWDNGGIFTVQDRGGAITKNHMDVYMNTKTEAYKFGRKHLDVYILGRCEDMSEQEDKDKKKEEEIVEITPIPEPVIPVNPTNRIVDKHNSILIVLCTVCNQPLGIPRDLERDLLLADCITCPNCRQRSNVTKELKYFIVQY